MNTELRIIRLERQNATMRYIFGLASIVATCCCIVGAAPRRDGEVLTIRELNLVDDTGRIRAVLSAKGNDAGLVFRTVDNKNVVALGIEAETARLSLSGRTPRKMRLDKDAPEVEDVPNVTLIASDKMSCLNVNRYSGSVSVRVADALGVSIKRNSQERAFLGMAKLDTENTLDTENVGDQPNAIPTLALFDRDGNVAWQSRY